MTRIHKISNPGGIDRPASKEDYLLGAAQISDAIPEVFMQDKAFGLPVLYQGKQPACGAHAGAALKMLLDDYESDGRYYTPRFTWVDLKTFDGYKTSDGTDMISIFKSLQKSGALDFPELGNDITISEAEYASPKVVSATMRTHANPRTIGPYGFTNNPSFSQVKQAISKNKGVLLLLTIGSSFYTDKNGNTSWAEKDILPLRPPISELSGHFVMAHSYDKDRIYFINSFSDKWGKKGHGYIGQNYMPFVREMGTAADLSDLVIPNLTAQLSILQQIVALLKKKMGLK